VVRPWRRSALTGLATWFGAVSAYVMVTMLSAMIDEKPGPALSRLYLTWNHWDTGHYMRISRVGYTLDRPDTHAFFPMYPVVLHVVDAIVPGPTLVATLILANVFCIAALIVLHRFAAREMGPAIADRTLFFLMAFPTGFFLCAGYNESLFLFLVVAAFYCLRSGRFWAAGAIGAIASATRLAGVLLVLPFAMEYARQHGWRLLSIPAPIRGLWRPNAAGSAPAASRRWSVGGMRPDVAAVLLIPVGLGSFAAYCWVVFGDPLDFAHAQLSWGKHFTPPWLSIGQVLGNVLGHPMLEPITLHNLLDFSIGLGSIVSLVLCVVGPWRLRRDQLSLVVFAAASLLTILTTPAGGIFPLAGMPRYALELIPGFLLLARLGEHHAFERIYLMLAIALQAVLILAFIRNVWVA
jgi:hypothetical protein